MAEVPGGLDLLYMGLTWGLLHKRFIRNRTRIYPVFFVCGSGVSIKFTLLEDCAPKMKNQFQVSKGKYYNTDTVVEKAVVDGYIYIYKYTYIHRATIFHQLSGI